MHSLQYKCSLKVTNPHAHEELYIELFGSRNRHIHSAFNEAVDATKLEFDLTYTLPDSDDEDLPSQLHICLFSNSFDKSGLYNQSLLAWGNVATASGGKVNLVDVKERTQAVLDMQPMQQHRASAAVQPSLSTPTSPAAEDMMNAVRRAYPADHDLNSFLNWVSTPMGKIPVLAFVASISSILSSADSKQHEAFLLRQFNVAGNNTALGEKQWGNCTHTEKAKWLAEMVTLMPRAMIYEPDTVRIGGGKADQLADQWVHLLCFPEPNIACFDCEDSALYALELLYLIQHVKFAASSPLAEVQEFCKPYTACFIFGSIKSGGDPSPHAYAALLDSDFLNGEKQQQQPSIVIEGTARVGGCWDQDPNTPDVELGFSVFSEIESELPRDRGYARTIRGEASLEMAAQKKIYGPVYAVMSGDHRGQSIHMLTRTPECKSVGVQACDVFSRKHRVIFSKVNYSRVDHAQILSLCAELPRSHIPDVSKCTDAEVKKGKFHMDMHYETYIRRKEEVDKAVQKIACKKSLKATAMQVQLTNQLRVQQWWFSPA